MKKEKGIEFLNGMSLVRFTFIRLNSSNYNNNGQSLLPE